jgi:hypothetical protein
MATGGRFPKKVSPPAAPRQNVSARLKPAIDDLSSGARPKIFSHGSACPPRRIHFLCVRCLFVGDLSLSCVGNEQSPERRAPSAGGDWEEDAAQPQQSAVDA